MRFSLARVFLHYGRGGDVFVDFFEKKDFFSFCFGIWHGRCNEDSAGLSIKVLARKKKGVER